VGVKEKRKKEKRVGKKVRAVTFGKINAVGGVLSKGVFHDT